jgi:hypothetical protein
LKAAEPDIESQPVNTAGFRNCGDEVPASLAIESERCNIAANSIAKTSCLPRAVPRSLAEGLPFATPAFACHDAVTGICLTAERHKFRQDDSNVRPSGSTGAFIGSALMRWGAASIGQALHELRHGSGTQSA